MSNGHEKLIEEIGKMSVVELAGLVKELEEKFGVSAAMPIAAAAAPAAQEAAQEEKSEYKVTLKEAGPEKIKNIKALRSVTTLSMMDAKKAIEEAPTVIAEAASKEDAKKIKEALEAAGAKVELS
ncbi:50S ribosomal protein L7/L12 [Candidatus Babeliales bacterium]|nr:50S ribosomal protein L7/L12 [Candidatus Babeliales bacterium]